MQLSSGAFIVNLLWSFIYVLALLMRAAYALVLLCTCLCSSENSPIAYMISTKLVNHVCLAQWFSDERLI